MRVLGLPPVRVCHHLDWFCWKKRRQLRQLIFYIRAATFSQKMYTLGLARNMDNILRLVNQSEENCKQQIKCWPVFRYERSKRGICFPSSILNMPQLNVADNSPQTSSTRPLFLWIRCLHSRVRKQLSCDTWDGSSYLKYCRYDLFDRIFSRYQTCSLSKWIYKNYVHFWRHLDPKQEIRHLQELNLRREGEWNALPKNCQETVIKLFW